MANISYWNPENIQDISESVGVTTLNDEVLHALTADVQYRVAQVIEEAQRFMRHSKRTIMTTKDIALALRVLDIEPLYGYESTRPLRFGEAMFGQPLFYVEDEEVDFERLINAPLPKIPREIAYTAHWLSVEGIQPSIPQNPASSDARGQEGLQKNASANPNLATISGADAASSKSLIKHVLSKEAQLYFERICAAILDENDESQRLGAMASIRGDPGVHQLVPYFVQYAAEKVTHNLKNLFILRQMLDLTLALMENDSLFIDPYVNALVPVILTCLLSPHIGTPGLLQDEFPLRASAASILGKTAKKYAKSSQTLRARLARSCLKAFLDPKKPLETHYGAILGLEAVSGREGVRTLILPNLKEYSSLIQDAQTAGQTGTTSAEYVISAIIGVLQSLRDDTGPLVNGFASGDVDSQRPKLENKVGGLLAERIIRQGDPKLVQAILT